MRSRRLWLRGWLATVCLTAAGAALAGGTAGSCEREATWVPSETVRHFLVLAGSRGVFYDRSGPSFVMLVKADAATGEAEMGAVGIYADEKRRAVFGPVPWQVYDPFLREPGKKSQSVMLRLEINEPQYERVLGVLRSWAKRALEDELLYPDDVFMNNILLVKQATEALNRCREAVHIYRLDWGLDDWISEDNAPSHVPYKAFEEMKRRNAALHVPDSKLPKGLLRVAGSKPLPARETAPSSGASDPAPMRHEHHDHHVHESAGAKE